MLASEEKVEEARKLFAARIEIASRKPGPEELANAWYDYACGEARAGHREETFDHLRQAVGHGYWDAQQMQTDNDLKSLRGDPRFEALIAEAQKRAAAASNTK